MPVASLALFERGPMIKGGETIKTIRNDTETQINITSSTANQQERIIKINGTAQGVTDAVGLICKAWKEFEGKDDDLAEVVLLVPRSQCSAVIGKGGSNVKEIREATGASVFIPSDDLPNSTEKAVKIKGSLQATKDAVSRICKIMLENPIKGSHISYNPLLPDVVSAFLTPRMGDSLRRGPSPSIRDMGLSAIVAAGSPSPTGRGDVMGLSPIVAALTGNVPAAGPIVPRGNSDKLKVEQITEEMKIDDQSVGTVIGKKGSTIAEMRILSGCGIRIVKGDGTEKSEEPKTIVITGDKESAAVAKSLIQLVINIHELKKVRGSMSNEGSTEPQVNPWKSTVHPDVMAALSELNRQRGNEIASHPWESKLHEDLIASLADR